MQILKKTLQFDEILENEIYVLGSTTGTKVNIQVYNTDLDAVDSTFLLVQSADGSNWSSLGSTQVTPNAAGTTTATEDHFQGFIGFTNVVQGTATSGSCKVIVTVK